MTARRPSPSTLALLLIGAMLAVNTLIRLGLPHSLEYDEAEQVFLSQWLKWGYGPQPPLYDWMQSGIFALFGYSVAALSIPKHLVLFTCYLFYWMAADLTVRDARLKAMAVLGLLTLPEVSYSNEIAFTHNVALLSMTALFLYGYFRIVKTPDLPGYVIAGIAIGLGFLAKYNCVLLPIAALLALGLDRTLRSRLLDRRFALAIAIAVLIALPHAIWAFSNIHDATAQSLAEMTRGRTMWHWTTPFVGLLRLVISTAEYVVATLAIFFALYRERSLSVLRSRSDITALIERMVTICFALLIVVVISTGATDVRARWLNPFLLVVPLYLVLKMEAAGPDEVPPRARPAIAVVIAMLIPVIYMSMTIASGWIGRYSKLSIPFQPFVVEVLAAQPRRPGLIIAEDVHTAGNMLFNAPDIPVVTSQFPHLELPVSKTGPQLAVWRGRSDGEIPAGLQAWTTDHGRLGEVRSVKLPYYYAKGDDAFSFGYAPITPNP